MKLIIVALTFVPIAGACAAGVNEFDACEKRQAELTPKAAAFQGETRIKRLIEADLKRAKQEENEGDADECMEALDHAAELIAGKY